MTNQTNTNSDQNAAVEAIKFALVTDEGLAFLKLWLHGEFDAIRREWPECPSTVFVRADPVEYPVEFARAMSIVR